MRIALLTAEYPPQPGGVGDYTHCLAQELMQQGHEVGVVTGTGAARQQGDEAARRDEAKRESEEGRNRFTVLRQISGWDWRCWHDTIRALDRLRPHVLHIQYQTGAYSMHPAINLLPWRLRALSYRPRVVVTFHDLLEPYLFPKAAWVRHWVTRRLAQDADGVIATNEEDAATLHAILSSRRFVSRFPLPHHWKMGLERSLARQRPSPLLHIIPIGSNIPVAPPSDYDRATWRASLGIAPDTFLIAYFGLLAPSKGVDIVLDALEVLRANPVCPALRLLLIGGAATTPQNRSYAAEVFAKIERAGLQPYVIKTGHVDAAVVSAHLLSSDVVALPFREGASLRSGSLIAALLHGAAVVTTSGKTHSSDTCMTAFSDAWSQASRHTETIPRLVDGEHVLLVSAGDSHALAAALQRMASSRDLRVRLRAAAQAVGKHFAWHTIACKHTQVYEQISLREDS